MHIQWYIAIDEANGKSLTFTIKLQPVRRAPCVQTWTIFVFQLQEAQNKVKRMGILMKEVRAWLDEAEQFIKLASLQEDPQKETEIQEKIEVRIKCYKIS